MRRFFSIAAIAIISICGLLSISAYAQETVKVGFIAPLTGFAAADGYSSLESAKLAVDYVNEHGGIKGKKLELVSYDDACQPDQASALTRKLIENDKVAVMISGSYSSPSRAAAVICQQAKVPFTSTYAVHPSIVEAGEYCHRIGMAAPIQGRTGGYFAVRELGAKRIALLIMNNDFGVSLAEALKETAIKLGAQIVYEKKYPLGETEFRNYLNAIKAADPDLIYAPGYYNEAANIVPQAREIGLKCWLMGDEGYDSPKFIELAGAAANGVFITTDLNRDSDRPMTQYFLKNYKERTNIDADMVGASAFDAVMLVSHILNKVGTDANKIIEYWDTIENFEDCSTGPILMFQNRSAIRPMDIQIVLNNQFRYFYRYYEPEVIYLNPPSEGK
ncbi:ABC transporter substrate-binding protein [Acetomicrobium sp.]|mgnify:CR=1 FL=1|uniref:ABC transporter substrate-binding protein n=1 Tax=Acetomicrobium sp. TaxID=1872099 RepID=UPI0028722894|nr:ABC transporter substrate-binding protein [Acetomicrobium sp.]MDR9770043.1 ABC transporter substrate-binding protein [Acetomicrobium sp.]HXK98730.1 ABC transporter substrate-binding protein [Acetomicrobium sp.]